MIIIQIQSIKCIRKTQLVLIIMDELLELSHLLKQGQRITQLQYVPVLLVLLCTVTTILGDELHHFDSDKGLLDNALNEAMGEEVVKLLDTDNKSSEEDLPCWKKGSFTTQGPCHACDEHAMKYARYCCGETGFRQLIQCEASNFKLYKSCPKSKWAMERSFWTFEGIMLVIWMSSFIIVVFRRRSLDWEALQRVRKQIANCV